MAKKEKEKKEKKKLMCLDILTTPYFPKYVFWSYSS